MAGDFQNAAIDTGGAVSSLFGARGARASAGSYEEAQRIAEENARIARSATAIRDAQLKRTIFKTLGAQQAQVAGAGFAASGSSLDILRDSASQGAHARAINEAQGAITANSYLEQAGMFGGMASAAHASATGQGIAGLLQAGGAAYSLYEGIGALFSSGAGEAGVAALAV